MKGPVETLGARDLGELVNAVDGPHWSDKRDVALIDVMARAELRLSEALALRLGDVEINPRGGNLLMKADKRPKERRPPLPTEARAAVQAYLRCVPKSPTIGCF